MGQFVGPHFARLFQISSKALGRASIEICEEVRSLFARNGVPSYNERVGQDVAKRKMVMGRIISYANVAWRKFLHSVNAASFDIVGPAIVVVLVWCFVFYWVFGGKRISASPKDIADITQAIAWPSTMAIMVLLFRNPLVRILDEVPSFIRRSYYRQGADLLDADGNSMTLDKEDVPGAPEGNHHKRDVLDRSVGALVRKFGGVCHFEKCIGNRKFIFDVVIETDDRIYGVEIKKLADVNSWGRVFGRVQSMYSTYDESLRSRFVFVVVVIGAVSDDDELKLRRMGQKQDFVTQVIIQNKE